MSDMSLPPLTLAPPVPRPHPGLAPSSQPQAGAPSVWPSPPALGYPAPTALTDGEGCEIEGPNGKVSAARLHGFDPESGRRLDPHPRV